MKDSDKIALITGITGQDGSYLSELLLERDYTVHGIVRRTSNMLRSRIEHLRRNEEIFGNASEIPQTENTPLWPTSPYGCAKAFATQLSRVYRESYGLFVCNGILYNHESPRRGENFVTRKIARAAARIARKLDDELVLGNLESQRDWGRAHDYVEAMWLMVQHKTADDYVVATGESHSVRDFVEAAFGVVDLPWEKYVKYDESFDRPTEPARLVGAADKIRRTLGWKPAGTFRQLVDEMVEAELAAIDSGATDSSEL